MNSRLLPATTSYFRLMPEVLPRIDRSAMRHLEDPRRCTSEGLPR